MCCRFVFIDRRFGLNSLEGKDKYSETDGAAEKKINPYRYSLCRNMISFTSLFLKGNSYLVLKMNAFQINKFLTAEVV